MKTFIFLLCTTVFSFTSENMLSQEKVIINQDQLVTIDEVFKIIKQQTDYKFIYPKALFKDAPKVQLKKGEILVSKLLEKTLLASNANFELSENNTIVIKQKPMSFRAESRSDVQGIQVTGTVKDETGLPLAGVTIILKDTNVGASTDFDGKFTITVPNTDSVLLFSYMGFANQEVTVGSQTSITVVLKESVSQLGEVVINAGYYSVKDKERTGSISSVKAKDIEKQPISNPLAAMQGRMAGVNITQSTGVPGGGFDIQIRGKNSLRLEGNNPLYLVDGLPFGTENLGSTLTSAGLLPGNGISPLNSLNPSDIQSIEVLKDADATAIYGSRGANGVVLITTKKGKSGKTNFNINSYTGISSITRKLELMNTQQYLAMREQAFINDGFTEFPFYAYDVNGTWDRNRFTDWQNELIGGTAYTNSVQATISGGSENTKFLLSGTNYKETTVFPGDFAFKKASVSFNINHISNDRKFEVLISGSYLADKNNLLGTDLTREAYSLAPNAPKVYNSDGTLNWENSTWNNPYRLLEEKYSATNNNLISNAMLQYRPFKGWEFKLGMGYSDSSLLESKASPNTIYDPSFGLGSEASSLILNDARLKSWNFEPQLEFHRNILGGEIKLLVGATFQSRTRNQDGLYAWGFSNNSFINNIAAASNVIALSTNNSEYRYGAVFGRLNYSFSDKYFLNLTGRRDGSSRFGPGKQFANFGAIGAAWLFSEEEFFNDKMKWLSFGKFRGSIGTTGNDQIGDYQYLNTYNLSGLNYEGVIGLEPTRLFNPNFSWEINKKIEGAIELGLFKDKLLLSTAYYHNRSSNQLVGIPLPGTTGFSFVTANLDATVQNTGWEFEIQGMLFNNQNFEWKTSFNLTIPKNKLVTFPNFDGSTYVNQYVIGEALDIQKVYHFTGINQQTGIYEFEDFDGDGQITPENDRGKIVQTAPEFFGGFQNTVNYKNWQFDFLFQFVKQVGRNYNSLGILPGISNNLPVDLLNAWQQPGDSSTIQPYTTGLNNDLTNAYYRFISSDAAFSDASFIRLKNLSLSYTIPFMPLETARCRVYVQGQNLFTITKFKGPDPENNSFGISLPPLRVFALGVELSI